jgi:hypothetical protein
VIRREIQMGTHGLRETRLLAVGIMMASLSFMGRAAQGQDLEPDRWKLSATPYMWLSGINGDVKVRDTEVDVDVPFSDILDALDFGALVHIEAQKGRWGLLSDVIYLALSTDKDLNVVNAKLEIDTWIVELGGFYRLGAGSRDSKTPMSLDVLVGGRYWNLDTELTIGPLGREATAGWVDPFVGLRWIGELTDWFALYVRGDIGGFGIYDEASKLTWNVDAGAAFNLSKSVALLAGYRALNIDRRERHNLDADLTLAGPEVGLMIRF